MAKILLDIKELERINAVLDQAAFKNITYFEVDVEQVAAIGKVTKLFIPHAIHGYKGIFETVITDENDW